MNKLRSFGWLLLGGLLLLVLQRDTAAFAGTAVYSGVAQIVGPLQLDLSLNPPIATPGDTLTLTLRLFNQAQVTYTPQVTVQFPAQLRPEINAIPSGAILNLQNNSLNWLPVVPANGGEQIFTLSVRVETADVTQPEQLVTAVLSYEQQSFTADTTLWIGVPPQISDILSPPQAAVGLPVSLRATFTGSAPISANWQPGDGRHISVAEPIIVYPMAGVYEITLTASNPAGSTSQSRLITIVPHPAAQFIPDDDTPEIGQVVNFLNQSGGEPPLRYTWEFGDGTIADSANPSHVYTTPGLYQVHLTIENQYGKSEAFWPVLVNSAPLADMVLPESGQVGLPLVGQAYGDESVTGFRWDMGDGQSYEGSQVSHMYRQAGDYYVTLLAMNEFGGTQIGRWLHIEPGILQTFLPLVLQLAAVETAADPYGLNLPPVTLETPFVLSPIAMPANISVPEQLFLYINEARRQFELQPLAYQYALSIAAQQHTGDMAAYGFTSHSGSDGSFPAERLLWAGYRAAYAGEATAWGFEHPYQAVAFWVNSPSHRSIILNQYATEVGVGFSVNYNSPNVWYWTAEFGNAFAPMIQPVFRVDEPVASLETMVTTPVQFSWNWPLPLEAGQQFVVYLWQNGRLLPIGQVTQPAWGTRYEWETAVTDWGIAPGSYEWLVKLESNGQPLLESEHRPITLLVDPNQLPTPTITPTATPTALPTATPVPTLPWPTYTPQPPPPTPVILVTATPQP